MDRAYSLLTLKSVDEEQRIIEGIASTIATDRVGDIVDPQGAKFTLPIPLLWQHNSREPVGQVISAKPSKTDIKIRAQFAKIADPGKLKDRLDEAWQSVKIGLVKGLSIGFRPLEEPEPIKGTWGLLFKSWEWLELSPVTIPANTEASILAVKYFDLGAPATGRAAFTHVSGASGMPSPTTERKDRSAMKTASERIAELKTTRTPLAVRMTELMKPVLEEGAELGDEEKKEYDRLDGQVKALDGDIARLEALERAQAAGARPVAVATIDEGSEVRSFASHSQARVKDTLPPGIAFARALMCQIAALKPGMSALEIAKSRYRDDPRIANYIKAAVAGATTTDSTWAGPLVDQTNLSSEFVEWLRPQTIVGKFGTGGIPALRRVPFNIRFNGQTSGSVAAWVGEAKQKPLRKVSYNANTLLWAKIAAIMVETEELFRFSNPSSDALLRDELGASIIERIDTDFVDPDKGIVANVSPASITNNVAPVTSSGTDAAAVRTDIAALMAPFIAAKIPLTQGVFITTNTVAMTLGLMRNAFGQPEFPGLNVNGGTLEGLPVIASQYALTGSPESNLLILVAANEIMLADDGGITVDVSRDASLEMSDDPENESGSVVSMFQTNQIALRAERFINWAKRRSAAVSFLDAVNYVAGSPA